MTQVRLDSVRKQFGNFVAIENLDLDISSGELVALLGPSGCGKTTTLRMISGLERPSNGAIFFDGKDVSEQAVQDRNVGMVFQRYALFPHMTVEKNVAFGPSVRGESKAEIARRIDEILEVVQLTPFRTRFPAQLSGGQMQRVAVARTLITKPSILMMDEPLANLDTKLRVEMRRFIRDLQQQFGITTISLRTTRSRQWNWLIVWRSFLTGNSRNTTRPSAYIATRDHLMLRISWAQRTFTPASYFPGTGSVPPWAN